jgi:hypothetical protein
VAKKPINFVEQNRRNFLKKQQAAKNASFARTALSFRPGGTPANIAGAQQNVKNIAGEFSGAYSANRALKDFSSAYKIAQKKGTGAYGDKEYWKKMASATGQTALAIPFAGSFIKGGVKIGSKLLSPFAKQQAKNKAAAEAAAKAARDKAAKEAAEKSRNDYIKDNDFIKDDILDGGINVSPIKTPPKAPPLPPKAPPKPTGKLGKALNFINKATPAGVAGVVGYQLATKPIESWEKGYKVPQQKPKPQQTTRGTSTTSTTSTYQVPKFETQFVPQQPTVTQQPPTTGGTGGGFTGTGDWRMGEEKDRQTTTQPPVTQELPPGTTPTFENLPYTPPAPGTPTFQNLPYTVTAPGTPTFLNAAQYGTQLPNTTATTIPSTFSPSTIAAGESGAMGAASIASQMAGAPTPASTVSEEGVNLSTMNQPRMTPMLGAAQVANAQYLADLAALASRSAAADAGLRERFSQNIMGARGGAADIIGGRAPAILGQAVTGARRDYSTGQSAQALSDLAEQEALRRTYSRSIQSAYKSEADKILKDVKERSQLAAQIRGIGVA